MSCSPGGSGACLEEEGSSRLHLCLCQGHHLPLETLHPDMWPIQCVCVWGGVFMTPFAKKWQWASQPPEQTEVGKKPLRM